MFNSVPHPAQLWLDYLLNVREGVMNLIKLIHFNMLCCLELLSLFWRSDYV